MSLVLETTIGDLTIDLFTNERPRACLNFLKLCKMKYYNFNLFHTIDRDFIAQTGDPTGVSDGGSSIWGVIEGDHKRYFEAESLPKIRHSVPGLLSMVSVGKHLVGSQFFLTLGADLASLDNQHCVIGEIVDGRDVLIKLNESICDDKHRPYQDIRITHTVVLEDPFDDPRNMRVPSRSPSPTAERLMNGRIAADEDIDDTEGKTAVEIQEMLQEREAKARATILEIVGDLPDADIAPPENVLFVCKLNPVTTDDDLEIIFSRFGKVKTCEVIRDRVSGDSLQYAFVEFEETKSCEQAFFKMDNVLIDDRRIHVDFSQSVAKIKWRGKGRGVWNEDGSSANAKISFDNLKEGNRGKNDGKFQRNNNKNGGNSGNERRRDFEDNRKGSDRRQFGGEADRGRERNDWHQERQQNYNRPERTERNHDRNVGKESFNRDRNNRRDHRDEDWRRNDYTRSDKNRGNDRNDGRDKRPDNRDRDVRKARSRSPINNSEQKSRQRYESPRRSDSSRNQEVDNRRPDRSREKSNERRRDKSSEEIKSKNFEKGRGRSPEKNRDRSSESYRKRSPEGKQIKRLENSRGRSPARKRDKSLERRRSSERKRDKSLVKEDSRKKNKKDKMRHQSSSSEDEPVKRKEKKSKKDKKKKDKKRRKKKSSSSSEDSSSDSTS